ncbi:MAG TPA: PqqD family protein [Solirubrobacteraceae bacterium]|nr:PqqD family protein [Solirubrobacteraceae bacterium]
MPKLNAELLEWRVVGDEVVALDLRSSVYLAVSAVGAHVWPLLAEGAEVDALVDAVVERFDVDAADARRDLDAFIASLDERGLLLP